MHRDRHEVTVWRRGENWVERYRHAPGPTAPVAAHAHDEYQFGLSLDAAGEYHYRGTRHPIPPGALRLIQPGEVHASRDFGADRPLTTHLLYVRPAVLHGLVAELGGATAAVPVFTAPVVDDPDLTTMFRRLCHLAEAEPGRAGASLAWESRLFETLAVLLDRHAEQRVVPPTAGTEPDAVATVRAYLHEHVADDVSLTSLAELAGLTPHYLDRAFARRVGMPPHRYQIQLRVLRAKALLAAGLATGAVATQTGFADQSHLGRHFKRLVGVTPGRYRSERAPSHGEEQA